MIELPFLSRIAPALDKLGLLFVSGVVIRSREGVVFGEMLPCGKSKEIAEIHYAPGIFRKLSMSRDAPTWFETVWSYCVEVVDYSTIFSMETK